MEQQRIYIPTLNDEPSDFRRLFEIWQQAGEYHWDVRFDFTNCRFLRPNAVAFLGGLARLIESHLGNVVFDWKSVHDEDVMKNICRNGFAGHFGYPESLYTGNSIPYREDKNCDMAGIMDYLERYWLGRGWVNVSTQLRDAIMGNVWELYNNAFEHSGTKIGAFTCGQYFPHKDRLILSVVDFGQGIPSKIRGFFRERADEGRVAQLTGARSLRWAFQAGNTTKIGEPAGSGLDLLKRFITVNQGTLEVYSNDGYVIINKDGERYDNCNFSFEGTVAHIRLRCDEKLYRLLSEA